MLHPSAYFSCLLVAAAIYAAPAHGGTNTWTGQGSGFGSSCGPRLFLAGLVECVEAHYQSNVGTGDPGCEWEVSSTAGPAWNGSQYTFTIYLQTTGTPIYPPPLACNSTTNRVWYFSPSCPAELPFDGQHWGCATTGAPAIDPPNIECLGNPCVPATAEKIQAFPDYRAPGIEFVRTWRSRSGANTFYTDNEQGWMPPGWAHSYMRRIAVDGSGAVTAILRPEGSLVSMYTAATGVYLARNASGLQARPVSSNEYAVFSQDGSRESYLRDSSCTDFRLETITNPAGRITTLEYDDGPCEMGPDRIVGPFGHTLEIVYDATTELIDYVVDAANNQIDYDYVVTSFTQLETVTFQDSSYQTYLYENSNAVGEHFLTGIVDEEAIEYATFGYDTQGRAISTTHAGGYHQWQLNYNGAIVTATDANAVPTTFSFRSSPVGTGRIAQMVALNGTARIRGNEGTGQQRPTSITDENGIVTRYYYDTFHVVSAVEAFGSPVIPQRQTTLSYLNDTSGLLTLATSPSACNDGTQRFKSTATSYLSGTQLISGRTESSWKKSSGTCQSTSRTTTVEYGGTSTFTQDHGLPTAIRGPRAGVADDTELTYFECTSGGACGQVETMTNAAGHVTTFDAYDAHGRLTEMTDPNGVVTTYSYDPRGRLTSVTETPPVGVARTTTYGYDAIGQLETVEAPNGTSLTYEYDSARNLVSISDNLGNSIEYSYDLVGNRTNEDIYDPSHNLRKTIEYEFDVRNYVESVNAAGSTMDLVWDAEGNLKETTDENSNITTYDYDPLDRLVKAVDALSGVTEYRYDINDRLVAVNAPNAASTRYGYDDFGNLLATGSPDTGITSYAYDEAGNLTSQTDANGVSVAYAYDALNRLTAVSYPNSNLDVALEYDQGTGQNGRLTTMIDGAGTTAFGYDAFGNVLEESKTVGSSTYDTTYEYDAADLVTSVTYPSGRTVDYARNVLGQITTVGSAYGGSSATLASGATYEPFGPLKSLTFGNSVALSRSFDQRYRLTDQVAGSVQDLSFTVDAAGNVDAIVDGVNAGLSQGFDQDALNRVTTDAGSYGTKGYTYDEVGNRLTRPHGLATQTLTYQAGLSAPDLAPHGVSSASSSGTPPGSSVSTLYLDASVTRVAPSAAVTAQLRNRPTGTSGRITLAAVGSANTPQTYISYQSVSSGTTSVNWNVAMPATPGQYEFRYFATTSTTSPLAAVSPTVTVTSSPPVGGGSLSYGGESNRLATHDGQTVTRDAAGNMLGDPAENVSFAYGAHNRMLEAYVGGVLRATYVYDGRGQRVKKIEATGAQRTLVYHYGLGGDLIGETVYSSAGAKIGERDYIWLDTLPLAQSERVFSGGLVTSSQLVYLHADQLNTPRLATDGSATVVWRWDSDAFGIGTANLDPDADTNLVNVRLRFPGQYLDEETGLHYNYFRDYDAITGRYIQSDPIGLDGGLNTYLYVSANPLSRSDPRGLQDRTAPGYTFPSVTPWPVGSEINTELASAVQNALTNAWDTIVDWCTEDDEERESRCAKLNKVDTDTCNAITRRRGSAAGQSCHASATQRYAACLRGQPLPPLNTWNN